MKDVFKKITKNDPKWYFDYPLKNKIFCSTVKHNNEYYILINDNEKRIINLNHNNFRFYLSPDGNHYFKCDNIHYLATTSFDKFTQEEKFLIQHHLNINDLTARKLAFLIDKHKSVTKVVILKIENNLNITGHYVDITEFKKSIDKLYGIFTKMSSEIQKEIDDYFK